MRKFIILGFTIMLATITLGQDSGKITDDGNNEISVNLGYLVFEIVELQYEHIINDEFSIGLAANYWFSTQENIDFLINPYFRFYPINTRRRAATFFIEGHAGIIGGRETEYYYPFNEISEPFVRGGGGFAFGAKFLSKNNFVGEGHIGIGRIFGSNSAPEVYPRVGINFGKRF